MTRPTIHVRYFHGKRHGFWYGSCRCLNGNERYTENESWWRVVKYLVFGR
jgi:hypothetical protein